MPDLFDIEQGTFVNEQMPEFLAQLCFALNEREAAVNRTLTEWKCADTTLKTYPVAADFAALPHGGDWTAGYYDRQFSGQEIIEFLMRGIENLLNPLLGTPYQKPAFTNWANVTELLTDAGYSDGWGVAPDALRISHPPTLERIRDCLKLLRWYSISVGIGYESSDGARASAYGTRYAVSPGIGATDAENVWDAAVAGGTADAFFVPEFVFHLGYRIGSVTDPVVRKIWSVIISEVTLRLSNVEHYAGLVVQPWTWRWSVQADTLYIEPSDPDHTITFENTLGDSITCVSGQNHTEGVSIPSTEFTHQNELPLGSEARVTFTIADPPSPPAGLPWNISQFNVGTGSYALKARAILPHYPSLLDDWSTENMTWRCDANTVFTYT